MANETIETSSFNYQKQEAEECCENVPPATVSGVSGPATPASTRNDKGKARLSGLHSALTPILKYINIGNKCPSPLPIFSCSNCPAKPNTASILPGDKENHAACSMLNENLPEITLLEVTCDSTMNISRNTRCDSALSTPVITKEKKKPWQVLDVNLNSKLCPSLASAPWINDEILPEITLLDDTCDSTQLLTRQGLPNAPDTPICKTETPEKHAEKNTEINTKSNESLILTPKLDTSYVVSEKETPTLETSDACLPINGTLETSEIILAKTSKLEISQCSLDKMSTTFSGNLTHSISSGSGTSDGIMEDVKKAQLQVTQDISMSSTLESSAQKTDKSQPVAETHPVNIICDLSASNTCVQCEGCQSSINLTSELQVEPVKVTSSLGEKQSCLSDKTEGGNQNEALNGTFCVVQGSADATTQVSVLQNRTLDLPTSNSGSLPPSKNENTNVSTKWVSLESSLVLNNNCSGSKLSQNSAIQNHTFEKGSQNSDGSMILVQPAVRRASLQNTFENKPNGTITCTETTAMDDKQQGAPEKSSPSPVKNVSPTDLNLQKTLGDNVQATTDSNAKPAEPLEGSFNINTPKGENAGSLRCNVGSNETKDSLNNGHPLCESIIHHSRFTEFHKANPFSLDNTFDFKSDQLVTSTPMVINKAFSFTVEREGKTAAAQKNLYGEGPIKPVVQISSNIVHDQKTATKPTILPMKPPSLLSKFKLGSLPLRRHDSPTSGHSMKTNTAQILQQTTEMPNSYNLRSTTAVASALKQPVSGLRKPAVSGIPSGNQRTGHSLKPPQAKSTSSVPSACDKPVGGTNPAAKTTLPTKRYHLPKTDALPLAKKKKIDTSSNKTEASAVFLDMAKAKCLKPPSHSQRNLPQAPKHDSAVPSSDAITACEPSSRVRTLRASATSLKAPTTKPQYHGCATCSSFEKQLKLKDKEIQELKKGSATCRSLEEQLKLKDEEINQLKEELLKWRRTEDPTS